MKHNNLDPWETHWGGTFKMQDYIIYLSLPKHAEEIIFEKGEGSVEKEVL